MHEDLINERENAKITRKELRGEILNTKRRKEEQLSANDVAVRQIERLKLALAEVKVENQEKRSVSNYLYKTIPRFSVVEFLLICILFLICGF